MSTQQRNSACVVRVDPSTVDVLRHQTLVVLEANHYFFEELLSFGPEAQVALSQIYRDAFAVLDAIGWAENPAAGPIDVPLGPSRARIAHDNAGPSAQLSNRAHALAAMSDLGG